MNNDRELLQQALDALESECGATKSWIGEALRARLAQPEPEPLWIRNEEGKLELQVPLHFLDPAKVARLIDEAFERGKKEIDMEQVKDIAQKLADCALLNSAPPKREWQGLTDEEIKEIIGPWGGEPIKGYTRELIDKIEEALRRKNT